MKKIFIAGHNGMVGSAIWRRLETAGRFQLMGKSRSELDLRNQRAVVDFIDQAKPDIVIDAAAVVGGILANDTYPYQFLMDNLLIQNNLIHSAHEKGVSKFIFLGSSCIYPRLAAQPLKEDSLLTGALEPTNEWYAIAKIAGVKACEAIRKQYQKDFVSLMPTNLYGPHDNFDLVTSHVLPAMIRKFHDAKVKQEASVLVWGSGTPLREFLHVDDLAEAVLFATEQTLPEHLYNVGSGHELSVNQLAELIKQIVGFQGTIQWDISKPDGTPRKLMDSSKLIEAGWTPKIELQAGIRATYSWFLNHTKEVKQVSIG
ncbi:MAG: GDP-L-fucose synthase [Cyclobacteriaceae bacterium]|nr:GDP-L-fucose synthase [Cyclobacteriaceae bacterium]